MVLANRIQQLTELIQEVSDQVRVYSALGPPPNDFGWAPDDVLTVGPLTVDHGRRRVFIGRGEVMLSPSEYKIMRELVRYAGKVVAHDDLSRIAYGPSGGKHANLKVYMSRLRAKINRASADDGACELQSVRTVGYRLKVGPDKTLRGSGHQPVQGQVR